MIIVRDEAVLALDDLAACREVDVLIDRPVRIILDRDGNRHDMILVHGVRL